MVFWSLAHLELWPGPRYLRNGQVIWVSKQVPTFPLLAQAAQYGNYGYGDDTVNIKWHFGQAWELSGCMCWPAHAGRTLLLSSYGL